MHPTTPALHQSLEQLLATQPQARRLVLAYSGGLDSHVLLHLLATHRAAWAKRTLTAVYVDHGWHHASAAWGEHCARICQDLDVPFQTLKIKAPPAVGESREAVARCARYAALAGILDANSALLTAHHQDDQAETLLLQLLRGAGPHGLAAMPVASRLGPGWLLRPLLEIDRAALLSYARAHGLVWIEDASNADPAFDRNYLRHCVLPLLQRRWPAAARTLARSARWCAEAAAELDQLAAADLVDAVAARADQLRLVVVRALSEQRQRSLLRYWLRTLALPAPDSRQLEQLRHDLLSAAPDRQPWVRWPGGEVRRYRGVLYAMPPLPPHDRQGSRLWISANGRYPDLELPGLGRLRLQPVVGAGVCAALLADPMLTVRFRQGGERFCPVGRHHSQELKKLLQDAGIPPWERDRLPLLYQGSTLVAVIGLGVAAQAAASADEPGWQPSLEPQ